jgi:glycerophosphoryl diester phosphodiesterase
MDDFRIFAHRGASGTEPENTIRSFRRALDMGAEWIEFDVHVAAGGELIVFHDERLDRRTDGTGLVADRSLDYIRSLDAGEGEKVPLLVEVMDLVSGRAGVNIELKGGRTAPPVAALISGRIRRGDWKPERILVSSFSRSELADFKTRCPDVPVGALFKDVPTELDLIRNGLGCDSVHLARNHVTAGTVEEAHRLGMKVFVYTVNKPKDAARLRTLGVDGVFTDYPDVLIRMTGSEWNAHGRPDGIESGLP